MKKGRLTMKGVSVLEQIILISIVNLEDEAYGMAIRRNIKDMTGKGLMYGTLYNALDQLLRKGYIQKLSKRQAAGVGFQGRVYYALTPNGREALQSAYELQKIVWRSVPDLVRDYES